MGLTPWDAWTVSDPEAPRDRHWFEPMAEHMGAAYLRYSFTRGTTQEVDFLIEELGLSSGMRVLDVGCGPGRHTAELASRGIETHGIDISPRFIEIARSDPPAGATYERADALEMTYESEFDAAISICQGAFGLAAMPGAPVPSVDPDGRILARMAAAVRPGGGVAVSAFSAYFQVCHLEAGERFDFDHGVNHERTTLRNEAGDESEHDLWTSCFTPRELRLLASIAGLDVKAIWSVSPGRYSRKAPGADDPEYLLIAQRR